MNLSENGIFGDSDFRFINFHAKLRPKSDDNFVAADSCGRATEIKVRSLSMKYVFVLRIAKKFH